MTPSVHPLLPHPLHHEVAQLAAGPAPLPHVQAGVEVQRVKTLISAEISCIRRVVALASHKCQICVCKVNSCLSEHFKVQ